MKTGVYLAGIVTAALLVVSGGLLQGVTSERWGLHSEVDQLASRFADMPQQFGPWKLLRSDELTEAAAEQLQCHGFLNQSYVHQSSQHVVRVAVLMGPPGPIAVHTPEICYSSREYALHGDREARQIEAADEESDEFWFVQFHRRDISAHRLSVYYGWCVDGHWAACKKPRFDFAGRRYLFKLQAASILPENDGSQTQDPVGEFLQEFLPSLRQHLFQATSPTQ